jgi:hypothetical protein
MQATRCRRFGQPAVASLFSHYMRFERNGHSFLAASFSPTAEVSFCGQVR